MTEKTSSLVDPFSDEIVDDLNDDENSLNEAHLAHKIIDSRRRLEDKLEQRYLEKDVREYDFDL